MRAIKQVIMAKQKNSRFFDYFLKKYGEQCTTLASEDEIGKNLRQFYTDLCYGNIQQKKYMPYIMADQRIITVPYNDSANRLTKAWMISEALKFSKMNGLQAMNQPIYDILLNEYLTEYNTYSCINQGLKYFLQTGDMNYLVQISVQYNNAMNRGSRVNF